jgi:hypothetical protein
MSYQAAILLLCGAASIVSAGAQPPAETRETASITERELRSDLQALAGDETGGRATASTGYILAATRAVERLKAAGVKPAFTDAQGREGWFQPVPLDRIVTGPDTCLRLSRTKDSVEFRHGKGMLVLYPGPGTRVVTGEPVFVGYAIHAPEEGWDDLAGLDLQGRIAVILAGSPGTGRGEPDLPAALRESFRNRREVERRTTQLLEERGASAVLVVPDQRTAKQWNTVRLYTLNMPLFPVEKPLGNERAEPRFSTILLSADAGRQLFEGLPYDPVARTGRYAPGPLRGVDVELRLELSRERIECPNVVGLVKGSDPALDGEIVVITAHLDALGRDGDRIYNGANDDASGCAAALEVMEAVALRPPRRSVMVLLTTGEEVGHWGSLHFVSHPPSMGRIVAALALEQLGRPSENPNWLLVLGPADLMATLKASDKRLAGENPGWSVVRPDALGIIRGSDGMSFWRAGIPSVLLAGGSFPEYHGPGDDPARISYSHLRRAARLAYALVIGLAGNW